MKMYNLKHLKENKGEVVFYFLTILTVVLFMTSCSKDEDVNQRLGLSPSFSATPTHDGGNEIIFKNTTKGDYAGMSWNFGNLTTSDKNTDTVLYLKKGTYTIRLNLYKAGDTVSTTQRVRIGNDFSNNRVKFKTKPSEENPNKIIFTNVTQAKSDSLRWDFGNGDVSTQSRDTVLFAFKGVYRITLTMYVGDQTFKKTGKIYVKKAGFSVSFDATPLSTSGKIAVENTTDIAVDSLRWDFGNGLTGTKNKDTVFYPFKGNHTLRLTIFLNGHSAQKSQNIQIAEDGLHVSFKEKPMNDNPNKIIFTNTTNDKGVKGLSFNWDFGNGINSSAQKDTILFSKAGSYDIQLSVARGSHQITTGKTINIAEDYQFVQNPDLKEQGAWQIARYDSRENDNIFSFDANKGLHIEKTDGKKYDRAVYQKIVFPEAGDYIMTGHANGYRKQNAYYQIFLLPATSDPTNTSGYSSDYLLYDLRPDGVNTQRDMDGDLGDLKYKGNGASDGTITIPAPGVYYLAIRVHNIAWSLTNGSGMTITNITIKQ